MDGLPGRIVCAWCGRDITEWCIPALLKLGTIADGTRYCFIVQCECGCMSQYAYTIPHRDPFGIGGIDWMFEPTMSKYVPPAVEYDERGMIKAKRART